MNYVHIISMDPATGSVSTRATCVLEDGKTAVECKGDEAIVEQLGTGVFHPGAMRHVTPDDGLVFLEALRHEYSHPTLMASDVIQGDTVEPYELPEESPTEKAA